MIKTILLLALLSINFSFSAYAQDSLKAYDYAILVKDNRYFKDKLKLFYGADSIVDIGTLKSGYKGKALEQNLNLILNTLNDLGKRGYKLTEFQTPDNSYILEMYILRREKIRKPK